MKNLIDGTECCFRCGMSREEVKRLQFGCNVWGKTYPHHLWTITDDASESRDKSETTAPTRH